MKSRSKFYGDLADSIEDGANPYELFSRKFALARERGNPIAPLFAFWRQRAASMNLRDTWEGTIPADDLMVIGSGERGDLPEALRFLAKVVTIREKNAKAIQLAVALPIFLLLLMTGVQVGVALGMMPIMEQIMPPERFPMVGKVLYYLSAAIRDYWYLIYGLPAALTCAYFWSLPRWSGPLRSRLDRRLPYSLYRDLKASEFLVSLAALSQANTGVFEAVQLLERGATPWMRGHLARIRVSLTANRSLLKAMDTGLFSEDIFDRIAEYSERSNFEDGIRKIGLTTIEEISVKIAERSAIIRNLLVVMVGGFILLTIAGMMMTALEAGNQIQQMTTGG
ncbi:type II secretion system F family protein [Chromobacterium sp. IIBBL 290-4]|uniref:type II secretion system F family protein n=1 Tax=Chromobacterium sp. IIBBL 290-4 TaxID=2953890 RepID=UPI0020B65AB5|nr:type II secretion system F family protein [Chromobacterium sp. IIBBL 290-4]UTH74133.1 type II secretion system F family protein [Chromobacterium sp. IIBBL 290-4]